MVHRHKGNRHRVATAVNSEMVTLYWSIGERIRRDILAWEQAPYGEQIVNAPRRKLSEEYGRGFSRLNLFHMIRSAETFPDRTIAYALSRQLTWTRLRQIIYLQDPLQREFYPQMCRIERWSTRTLENKIQGSTKGRPSAENPNTRSGTRAGDPAQRGARELVEFNFREIWGKKHDPNCWCGVVATESRFPRWLPWCLFGVCFYGAPGRLKGIG